MIKDNIKQKKKKKKIVNKQLNKKEKKIIREETKDKSYVKISEDKKNVYKIRKDVVDICTIIEKCSIDEISKYLLKKNKKFPDITQRQQ